MKAVLGVVSLMMVFQYSCTVGGRLEKKKENLDQLYEGSKMNLLVTRLQMYF